MTCLSIWRMKKTINAVFGQLADCEEKSVIHFELLKDNCDLGDFSMADCIVFFSVVTLA